MGYERLLSTAEQYGLSVYETKFRSRSKGLIKGNVIGISSRLRSVEKTCALAEELGHYHTSIGDILDQTDLSNRKQERRAREWAYNYLIPLRRLVEAYHAKVKGRFTIAEYLGVTEEFLQDCINRYIDKYGLCAIVDEQYTIWFEPLSVIERFE